ncbi:MAG TPA: N-methyl-L-tryptophan oxidase [Caldimonas sp.]|nr:N-methyl-L-tryptophan oxidase [Caldimonas sp.]
MNFDVIVIGLGAMGSATAYQLARRGARVLGIDRFHPPHELGSSHGATRITRLSVGEGAEYVPLVRRSHRIWREIEAASGEELMLTTGGLVIGRMQGGSELHGQRDFVSMTIELARSFGIAHELLDADAIARRFPQFLVRCDERAYFEPEAGVLRPERCVAAQIELARRGGARIVTGEAVTGLAAEGDAVTVQTAIGCYHAAHAVVTAGAWIPGLVNGRYARTLRVQRQTLHWFEANEPASYAPGRCPVFIWSHGETASDAFYGVPMADGVAGVKVGTQQHEADTTPDTVERSVARAESEAMHARHVRGRLRGVGAQPVQAATCLYTVAPEARFVVDLHPEVERAMVVSACSGHGFKHSAALGEAVAETLLEGHSSLDLAPFAWR